MKIRQVKAFLAVVKTGSVSELDAGDRRHALGGRKAERLELVPATGLKDGRSGLKSGHDGNPSFEEATW